MTENDTGFQGRWQLDEQTAPVTASITITDAGLMIDAAGGHGATLWAFEDIAARTRLKRGEVARLVSHTVPGRGLVVSGPGFAGALLYAAPQLASAHRGRLNENRTLRSVIWGLAAITALTCLLVFAGARMAAGLVPESWLAGLGDMAAGEITQAGQLVCESPAAEAAIARIMAQLAPAEPEGAPSRMPAVTLVNRDTINAMAVPGGRLFMLDGLTKAVETPEQWVFVLAHELAHDIHRDPATALVRQAGLAALLVWLTGGGTGADILHHLGVSAYSREAEARADRTALSLMHDAGMDTTTVPGFFDVLAEAAGSGGASMPEILSSHPASADRRDALADAVQRGEPAMSQADWAAIRAACE